MNYLRAVSRRNRALVTCRKARSDLHVMTGQLIRTYHARPWPIVTTAAGVGFLLAWLRIGRGCAAVALQVATRSRWAWLRQYLNQTVI